MTTLTAQQSVYSEGSSWKIFDKIYKRYDFLNHFLSFNLDRSWRIHLSQLLPQKADLILLDLATGTGDVIFRLLENSKNISMAYGIDLSENMLQLAREKSKTLGFSQKVDFKTGDFSRIPFADQSVDCVTIAFGIRNAPYPIEVLKEMRRVLKPGGCALIMEFSQPTNPLINFVNKIYLNFILPVIGAIFSGDFKAYSYLSKTISKFPHGEAFNKLMREASFNNIRGIPLSFGVATIYVGEE